ncbi:MAG: hypothetical protein ACI9NC_003935 [Verrucomicrobiales bacterium]
MGRIDGQRAVEFALADDSPVRIAPGARSAMAGWALAVARDWVEGLEQGNRRNAMVYGLLDGWSQTDLGAAAAYTENQPRSNTPTEMIDLLLSRYLQRGGTGAARTWFDGILGEGHNDTYQRRAFLRVAQEMATVDPSAAAQWITDHSGENYAGGDVVSSVVQTWAKNDPTATLSWILGQPGNEQNGRIGLAIAEWTKSDPLAASDWLNERGEESYYDGAARLLAQNLSREDPNWAMRWADSIVDEEQRSATIDEVGARWLRADADTATAGLLARGLSEEKIEAMKKRGENVWHMSGLTFEGFRSSDTPIILKGGAQLGWRPAEDRADYRRRVARELFVPSGNRLRRYGRSSSERGLDGRQVRGVSRRQGRTEAISSQSIGLHRLAHRLR